jgi:hypothetical protein
MDRITKKNDVETPEHRTMSTRHLQSKSGLADQPPTAALVEQSLPAPWNNKAERAFKDYYMRHNGGPYKDQEEEDNFQQSNAERIRRKAKTVLRAIPSEYSEPTKKAPKSKFDDKKAKFEAAQEAAYQTTIDEAGECEINKTTIEGSNQGSTTRKKGVAGTTVPSARSPSPAIRSRQKQATMTSQRMKHSALNDGLMSTLLAHKYDARTQGQ